MKKWTNKIKELKSDYYSNKKVLIISTNNIDIICLQETKCTESEGEKVLNDNIKKTETNYVSVIKKVKKDNQLHPAQAFGSPNLTT